MSKTKIPAKLRTIVLNRDNHKCLWCGRSTVDGIILHIDHIIPEKFGGSTTEENLGTLCSICNLGKGSDYYGQYLLSSILKIPNLWDKMIQRDLGTRLSPIDGQYYDGMWQELKISFYHDKRNGYENVTIKHYFLISDPLLISNDSPDTQIQISKIKNQAILEIKTKVKEYLISHNSFLEEIDSRIILREIK
jgi:hypothetical protein